jgi:hypothetical protein
LVVLTDDDLKTRGMRVSTIDSTDSFAVALGVDDYTADLIRQDIDACVDVDTSSKVFKDIFKRERKEHPSFSNDQIRQIVMDHFRADELGLSIKPKKQWWTVWLRKKDYEDNRDKIRKIALKAEKKHNTRATADLVRTTFDAAIYGENRMAMYEIYWGIIKLGIEAFITPYEPIIDGGNVSNKIRTKGGYVPSWVPPEIKRSISKAESTKRTKKHREVIYKKRLTALRKARRVLREKRKKAKKRRKKK